ncbi:MAG: LPS export ABC transporter periplasmic protein LptC [Geminicoccaceae bacterium]
MSGRDKSELSTQLLGERHSRRVDRLRFLLPVVALSLLGMVMAWPWLTGGYHGLIMPVFSRTIGIDSDMMRMQQPRYVGRYQETDAYEVTAASALLDPKNPNRIHLDQLIAVFDQKDADEMRLRANDGIYSRSDETLDLEGDIQFIFGAGYRFETSHSKLDFVAGTVVGDHPVTGDGPTGTLAADRFNIVDGGKIMRFEGRVRVTLQPGQPDT